MNKPLFPDVIVNGHVIPSADIAAEAQNHNAPKGKPGLAWRAAARALVIRSLLLQEAQRLELTSDPQEIGPGKFETDDEALIRQVMEIAISPDTPDEATLRRIYDETPDRFRAPSIYEPAHILLSGDDAEAIAPKLIAQITQTPKAFGQLAAEHSICSSRENGGRLGQIVTGDTVAEFEAAMDAMDADTLCPTPVKTRYGLHILRLDAKERGAILPYDTARATISEALEKAAWTHAARAFVDALVAAADISGIDLTPS